ncbi:MAG: alpha/beta hydrolase [Anaerolineae bacterium]|nr:alpha/beta hydrolase [Chloroflexota bacterium]
MNSDPWDALRATEIPLYAGVAPGSEEWHQTETEGLVPPALRVVRNVTRPSITPMLPPGSGASRAAVIIAPGGAFRFLAWDHEGIDVARWLNARGVAAFILKYRLFETGDDFPNDAAAGHSRRGPDDRVFIHDLILSDALQAIRLVRECAVRWNIAADRVGIMGFSAGGYVAAAAATEYDASSRPDFCAPIYGAAPVLTVPVDAPPLFIAAAADDRLVGRSLALFDAWRAANHEAELHIYARGGHGFGMRHNGLPSDGWIERFYQWMEMLGLVA